MSTPVITASELHMGSPIYASGSEKLGCLRFVISNLEAPYEVKQLVIDCGFQVAHDVAIPVESVSSSSKSGIHLSITADDFLELPAFDDSRYFTRSRPFRENPVHLNNNRAPKRPNNNRKQTPRRSSHFSRNNQSRI